MAQRDYHKEILGRGERIDFVDTELSAIPAKVDTGAYRSAVHADNIALSTDGTTLTFDLLSGHPACEGKTQHVTTKRFTRVLVASSFGHREERYSVRLKVRLGTKVVVSDFSLADRHTRAYPVLLGRRTLSGRFMIDTDRSQVDASDLRAKYGATLASN